jgi:Mg-chelatase subunit ChlD
MFFRLWSCFCLLPFAFYLHMSLSFIEPSFLALLLLLPLLWAFGYATRMVNIARLGRARFSGLLLVRSLALLALCLALAGAQLVRPVDNLTVVFLVDGSDSLAPAQRAAAVEYIEAALRSQRAGDRAAVVLFGASALVERAPAPLSSLGRLTSAVVASRTNISQAIETGLALLPADSQKRLVLLSDGAENSGRAIEAARLAALRGVPIDVLALPAAPGPDVVVAGLEAPASAREGQELPLTVRISSAVATGGRAQIFVDGELVGTEELAIAPGQSALTINVPAGEAGFRRFEVRLEADGDTQPLNNRAGSFTTVEGPPRVLLIASDAARAEPLRAALTAGGIRSEIFGPAQAPAEQAALRQYAAVFLVDVLANQVPRALQEALPRYVREGGGSLAMIGGGESFGAGGWRRSPVAEALPVELDPKAPEQRADLALALVIDRSGSMAEISGSVTKLQLAKEAVYQASLGLERNDQIGVIVFDDSAQTVLPIQRLPDLGAIEAALSQISDGGGTNIRSGIEIAARDMPAVDARVKHIILLTDGLADSNYADLIGQLRADQVTITIVSIGADANPELRQIAQLGGGEYYRVATLSDVPRIFLAETVRVAQRDLIEGPFTPAIALDAPPVRGLGGLPQLYGYNATELRPAARTLLVAREGNRPILAIWQYGLGRGLAWTSDLKGQWGRDWLAWAEFPRFASGLVDALLPPRTGDSLLLEARAEGPQAAFSLELRDQAGLPLEQASIAGRLLGPDGSGSDLIFSQVGPGRYRAVAPAETPGVYLAQVAALDTDGQAIGAASSGLAVNYSPEYAAQGVNQPLLDELAALTGGRSAPLASAVFESPSQAVGQVSEVSIPLIWLALALLPLDIALRRLLLRRRDLAPLAEQLRPAPRPAAAIPATDPRLARLQSARARAGRREEPPAASAPPPTPQPPAERVAPPSPPPPSPAAPPPADTAQTLAERLAARRKGQK